MYESKMFDEQLIEIIETVKRQANAQSQFICTKLNNRANTDLSIGSVVIRSLDNTCTY